MGNTVGPDSCYRNSCQMPCWPDIGERVKSFLPMLAVLSSVLAYLAVVVFLLWAPKIRKRWLLITSRILGAAGAVPVAIALPPLFLGLLFASGNPPTRTRIVRSPDGQQAELNYDAGFLGRDYTKVTLKRSGCCRHIVVFWHGGPSWFDDPKIEWLDNRHVRITYHTRRDDPQHCEQKMGDIAVACISSPWPDSPTLDQPQTGVSAKP
jgi:hypothetical protein